MQATAIWLNEDRLEMQTRGMKFITDQKPGDPADPSPVDYMVASYAGCIGYFIAKFLRRKGFEPKNLKVTVEGKYVEGPHRIGSFEVNVELPPGIPQDWHELVKRSAEGCTIHHTLAHPSTTTFNYNFNQ